MNTFFYELGLEKRAGGAGQFISSILRGGENVASHYQPVAMLRIGEHVIPGKGFSRPLPRPKFYKFYETLGHNISNMHAPAPGSVPTPGAIPGFKPAWGSPMAPAPGSVPTPGAIPGFKPAWGSPMAPQAQSGLINQMRQAFLQGANPNGFANGFGTGGGSWMTRPFVQGHNMLTGTGAGLSNMIGQGLQYLNLPGLNRLGSFMSNNAGQIGHTLPWAGAAYGLGHHNAPNYDPALYNTYLAQQHLIDSYRNMGPWDHIQASLGGLFGR